MKKILVLLFVACVSSAAFAQQEITLDHVTGWVNDTTLSAGKTHVFQLRLTNLPNAPCNTATYNLSNGFVVYSPDGATWNRTAGSIGDALSRWRDGIFISHSDFIDGVWVRTPGDNTPFPPIPPGTFPADGVGPDGVGFALVTFCIFCSLPPGFDEVGWLIEIESNLVDTGLHICIDSASGIPGAGAWAWAGVARAECNVAPDWDGPHCFTLSPRCCRGGTVGNINWDDNNLVDIEDVTLLIDHLFIYFPPLLCPEEGNVDGDPEGNVDIADLTLLLDHLFINFPSLPACE